MARTGERVVADRYAVQQLLGAGGFGRVYRAYDRVEGRDVAIKFFVVRTDDDRVRIRREAAALRQLAIPGVVRLLGCSLEEAEPYVVMELVDGRPFPGDVPAHQSARWNAVREAVVRLLGVLEQVHRCGILHRDLKPPNVHVASDGTVTLLDFGLARGPPLGMTVTDPGAFLGTLRYVAPEQLLGQRVDSRTDLFAVGVMTFETMAGKPPFPDATTFLEYVASRLAPAPSLRVEAPWVPEEADAFVAGLLQFDANRRPASASEAMAALA